MKLEIRNNIVNWIDNILQPDNGPAPDVDTLWVLPVSRDTKAPHGFSISAQYLKSLFGLTANTVGQYRELTYPMIEKMIELGIIVVPSDPKEVTSIDIRKKVLNWYRRLSLNEKKQIPIFGQLISWKRIPKEQRPVTTMADLRRYEIVNEAVDQIHEDLLKLGIIDGEYQTVAERHKDRAERQKDKAETKIDRFKRLASYSLNVTNDFKEPSVEEPFIQVEQLFAVQALTVVSDSGKGNYRNACYLLIEYLSERYGDAPLHITQSFDEHLLVKYRKYLQKQIISDDVSSHHANTVFSAVRATLKRLTEVQGLGYTFYDINGFDTSRKTNAKKPFINIERLQISKAIELAKAESLEKIQPYQKSGIGENPLDNNGMIKPGMHSLENARWLFENTFSCKPIHYNTAETSIEKAFLAIITRSEQGLAETYKEWGVTAMITPDLVYPYLMELAKVTGMNVDSLLGLDVDDYNEKHPATSKPCLHYWKERSDGFKDYHLDLFKSDITWLTISQAKAVKNIINDVLEITGSFRGDIEDPEIKEKLFIFQSLGVKDYGRASSFSDTQLGTLSKSFVEKYNITDGENPTTLNLSRFRPTFVSEMINDGVSLREIQLMLGHSSIAVTVKYLDSLDFNSISRMKINDKLREIHDSTLKERVEEVEDKKTDSDEVEVVFQTPLAGCKNIFSPPDFVKNLPTYVPGNPCSQYNKCIGCDNVIITAKDLPEIFAMKRDYLHLLDHSRVLDTPYGHVVKENLELIDGIINPDLTDFSAEELADGMRLAEYVDSTVLVDGVSL